MHRLILVVLAGCVLSMPTYPQRAYDNNTESKLIALEHLVRGQAIANKDLNTLNAFLADQVVLVSVEGRAQSKEEFLAELQALDALRFAMENVTVRLHGNTVAVTGLFQMSGVRRGKPFVRQGRFLDTWLNEYGRWQIIASLSTPGDGPRSKW